MAIITRPQCADYDKGWEATFGKKEKPSDFEPYPIDKPPRYNGGVLCDMWRGPCACGAWHDGANDPLEKP